jgi:hypothetical protein
MADKCHPFFRAPRVSLLGCTTDEKYPIKGEGGTDEKYPIKKVAYGEKGEGGTDEKYPIKKVAYGERTDR